MAEVALVAEVGRPTGSRATRRLRRDGLIPGIVYGHGTDPVSVAVVAKDLRIALSGESGSNTLLSLQAGEQTFLTLAREMQRHPVRGTVTPAGTGIGCLPILDIVAPAHQTWARTSPPTPAARASDRKSVV